MFEHPVIKIFAGFSILGILSLILISYDLMRKRGVGEKLMDTFSILLSKEDLDSLHDDYSMVEGVVEKIVEQAKNQGYIPPEESTDA